MSIDQLPVWPFRPNWADPLTEGMEYLTSVLSSPAGAEQRRALRFFPRRDFEYSIFLARQDRAWAENYLRNTGASKYWMPLWADAVEVPAGSVVGQTVIPVENAADREYTVGGTITLVDTSTCRISDALEVTAIGANSITVANPSSASFVANVFVAPAIKAYLNPTDQNGIQLTRLSDSVLTTSTRLYHAEPGEVQDVDAVPNGPLILDGLIVNAWAYSSGRGDYFHANSGTSEGQFIFIHAALMASTVLATGTTQERAASRWFRKLVYTMLDAMGDGSLNGPMLRQPVPTDPDTICELHWLFAARGDIPERNLLYSYEATPGDDGKLRITENARGASVYDVMMIYPSTSQLLYDGVSSPAYDIANPGNPTQTTLTSDDWQVEQFDTAITIPAKNDHGDPNPSGNYKIVYGYNGAAMIPCKWAYEAYPDWTLIAPGYAACAPDTFRWFDAAMADVINFDTRAGNAEKWSNLRTAMRRTCCKGQSIDDLRVILEPMPGFDAIPVSGDPTGMFCYSDNSNAQPPSVSGANPGWTGYSFWSRDDAGNLVGTIPTSIDRQFAQLPEFVQMFFEIASGNFTGTLPDTISQTQIGRGFDDEWRAAESYQDPDWYIYLEVASNRPLAKGELCLLYLSATQQYDQDQRWFADLSTIDGWSPVTDGSTTLNKLKIPLSAFRLRKDGSVGSTDWGATLVAGQTLQAYGISVETVAPITVRIGKLRPLSGVSQAWVDANMDQALLGSKMPFFPGSLPFAINADTRKQMFVGWNGSPFHGYQQPDLWLTMETDAEAVHPDLDPSRDLAVPADDGSLTFPINPTDSAGATKPKAAMLCEQQIQFLAKAQAHWHADGGPLGPFAHTFVMNTPARSSLGNPTPYTWVYVNDDPNTRWGGYQARPVESLAKLVLGANGQTGWKDAHDLALTTVMNWYDWFYANWAGSPHHIFTDFIDPKQGPVQANYDEPHMAALLLRGCLWLKMAGQMTYADTLMVKLWDYLEYIWSYNQGTAMAGTWSDNPSTQDWYGFWHGEIIITMSLLLQNPTQVPSGIDLALVRQRLMDTYQWLTDVGVKSSLSAELPGQTNWNGYGVITVEPNETQDMKRVLTRLMSELDNDMAPPLFSDTANRAFEQQQMSFSFEGRADLASFVAFFEACRGQQVPFWMPTFMEDFVLKNDIAAGDTQLTVQDVGYTDYTFSDGTHLNVVLQYVDGTMDFCEIIDAVKGGDGTEVLILQEPIEEARPVQSVARISYLNLMRFAQDRIELNYMTTKEGVTTLSVLVESAPELRQEVAAFFS
ncbi:hypothetical protein MSKU15_0650 [Komagataeibacter diospyri]|uniref:hypothetical protein n=1 Tax=Komagataeibacter diospyri TaxID=1932662 RepID=UPI00113D9C11|nr:hypothetical protein [Komagataeibacter diospyri]GCE89049.1 hypothetical protein MSKU15_0650 [Komagataeibacter diospyri]